MSNVTEYLGAVQDTDLVGRTIPIVVDREGRTLRFGMVIVSYPVFHVSVFGPLLGVTLLFFGLYVFFKKRDDRSAELYLVLNACLFVMLALSNHILKQAASVLLPLLWGLALITVIPVNLHFYLVFPEPKSLLKKKPWLLAGLYIIPLALAALFVWTGFQAHFAMRAGIDCTQDLERMRGLLVATFFVGLVSCPAFAASIIHSYVRAGSPEHKKQVQILLIGAMVTLLFAVPVVCGLTLFVTGSGGAVGWPPWVFPGLYGLTVLTTIFLPLFMALAITNALAFEEIDGLNRDLQRKMTKVEEQRSEILQLQERLLDENRYLKEEIGRQYDFAEIVGATHGLKQVMAIVEKAAESDATILVSGESGTGKELVARAIHFNSHLRGGPFIKVNCAALSEGVLQSELFGHEKGAFTGAHERRTGRFELADGGTIFLDEIGDIPASMQVLLLRVLQEQAFERVGGSETIKVRVRVIAATNRNLEALVAEDRFRTDLYYRLKVITIEVPPLRERPSDILELSLHFVRKYAQKYGKRILKLDDPVVEQLKRYAWPGNVRELENILERAVVLSRGESLSLGEIPMELKKTGRPWEPPETRQGQTGSHAEVISEIERQRLVDALEKARANKSEAARSLGLKRSTFFNKLKRYGLLAG